jgi:hypothetical protein
LERYGEDLAAIHAAGFTEIASEAAAELLPRLSRGEELHRLRLHRPAEVLGALRAAGFAARTLPGGYAGVPLPRGLVAYLARKR